MYSDQIEQNQYDKPACAMPFYGGQQGWRGLVKLPGLILEMVQR